jgi:plasmid stability protein
LRAQYLDDVAPALRWRAAVVTITVRNIDAETAERLKAKAAANRTSVNEIARAAIAAYVKPDKAELLARADALRKKLGQLSGDSTISIREDRDRL